LELKHIKNIFIITEIFSVKKQIETPKKRKNMYSHTQKKYPTTKTQPWAAENPNGLRLHYPLSPPCLSAYRGIGRPFLLPPSASGCWCSSEWNRIEYNVGTRTQNQSPACFCWIGIRYKRSYRQWFELFLLMFCFFFGSWLFV